MNNEKGQLLLIGVFIISLSLIVLFYTVSRSIFSVRRVYRSVYYQKSNAAAKAGAEILLAESMSSLQDFATVGGRVYCPVSGLSNLSAVRPECIFNFGESRAFIGVESYPIQTSVQNNVESLTISAAPYEVVHINLVGASSDLNFIMVCWKGLGKHSYSVSHYFYYYGSNPYLVERGSFLCNPIFNSWCKVPLENVGNIPQAQAVLNNSCYMVQLKTNSLGLRLISFPDYVEYKITGYRDTSNFLKVSLPQQGYRIVSIGEVVSTGSARLSLEDKKAARKKIVVEKTFPFPIHPWWDFAITSINGSVNP